jgi:uncharacterized protein (DUF2267 family)
MPYPAEYQRAYDYFARFLSDAKIISGLGSVHQAYTMVQGVFQVFRRRLTLRESIIFTSALNVGLRALYISEWNPDEEIMPFGTVEEMNKEVRLLRPEHNFSTDTAIMDVAKALRKNVDEKRFNDMLNRLPAEARNFWNIS